MSAEIDQNLLSELGDFEFDDDDDGVPPICSSYVNALSQQSTLKLLQKARIDKAFNDSGCLGLFRLFITRSWFEAMRSWLNIRRKEKGLDAVNESKFNAYLGLELAMSLIPFNAITNYWSENLFSGHIDFKETLPRDQFTTIRANITLCNPSLYEHDVASHDPLWHSRKMLEHFQKNISKIAVPMGCSALDEAGFGTKARTRAKSYCPLKPDKYAVRFYAVVGHSNAYLSSIFDNRSGNTTPISPPEAYCRLHRELRTPFNKVFDNQTDVDKDSPSALWCLMMAHQTKAFKSTCGKRIFFSDNYYTRHVLAKCLKNMTDGEARIIGTVKYTNVDATNRFYLTKAIQQLKDADRCSWKLVRTYDKNTEIEKYRRKHTNAMKKLNVKNRTPFVPPHDKVAEKAGYIVWKDKKIVIFYTNDLASSPSIPIMDGSTPEARSAVNGLAVLSRWTGKEIFHRTNFSVPSPIVAYNLFMNSVDRMDQKRSALPCKRKEQRLQMSAFTYLLDLACLQAYAIYSDIETSKNKMLLIQFKRKLCKTLVEPYRAERKRSQNPVIPYDANFVVGTIDNKHMLLENVNKRDIDCYLCKIRGIEKRTIYGCCACGKGFCVNCFTAYHCKHMLSNNMQALVKTIIATNEQTHCSTKKSAHVQHVTNLELREK